MKIIFKMAKLYMYMYIYIYMDRQTDKDMYKKTGGYKGGT